MTMVDTETGVILDPVHAEERATRICTDLDGAADQFESAMEQMRKAVRDRDDLALGYRSPGDYLSDRFGGRLARLGVDLRREVVRELTEAGLSTRAIAPVVGVSQRTVVRELAGESHDSPADDTAALAEGYGPGKPEGGLIPVARPPVTGIDGKNYPGGRPRPEPTRTRPRRALADQFFDAAFDLTKAVDRIARLADDDRFTQNAEKVAAKNRDDLLRARDVLDDVIARLP